MICILSKLESSLVRECANVDQDLGKCNTEIISKAFVSLLAQ
jgi:hypothetical protein